MDDEGVALSVADAVSSFEKLPNDDDLDIDDVTLGVPVRLKVIVRLPVCSNVRVSVVLTVMDPDLEAENSNVIDMLGDRDMDTSDVLDRVTESPDRVPD